VLFRSFLVSIAPADLGQWQRMMTGVPKGLIGTVSSDEQVMVQNGESGIASISVKEIRAAWTGRQGEGA
jgi:hypothetical protein